MLVAVAAALVSGALCAPRKASAAFVWDGRPMVPVVNASVRPPIDLTARECLLYGYTGEAIRLQERALDTHDQKDVRAFLERVHNHPEEAKGALITYKQAPK